MRNIVAIVGRPNVGKSTFYNRLVDSTKSITDNDRGTTRDRNYGIAEWCGISFTAVDTGGYTEGKDIFSEEIRQQVKIALEEADVILFLVDCKSGLLAEDIEFSKILREVKKKIFLVANKADNLNLSWTASDFYSIGLGDPISISSSSGSGTGDLLDEVVKYLDSSFCHDESEIPRVAIIGRPNVGKSSLLNSLIGEIRCVTSSIAGTTRDSIDVKYNLYGHEMILTDTAGLRKKNKEKEDVEFYSTMRSIAALKDSDICIIMIDASQNIEAQDVSLIGLAHKYKKGIVILVNKWDLIEKDNKTHLEYKKYILEKIAPIKDVPIVFISATTKKRIFDAIQIATDVYQRMKKKIPTSELNQVLLPIIEKCPPPAIKGKYIKIKYISMLPTRSITIGFFCNLPQYIKPPYKLFLENQIRQNFSLSGVPVTLVFKKK